MALINILVGAGLLFFGRRVFWLFVAGAGFVAGLAFANRILQGSEAVSMIIGIGIGLFAALLAVFLQRFAIGMAGFLVGGYIALQILPSLNLEGSWGSWLGFLLGGLMGVFLVSMFLDWGLITLSSLAGASLVIDALDLNYGISALVFVLLIVSGITYQARELKRKRR